MIELQPPKKRLSFFEETSQRSIIDIEGKENKNLAKIDELTETNDDEVQPKPEGNIINPEEVIKEEFIEEGKEGDDDDSEAGLNNSLEVPFEDDDMISFEVMDDVDYIMEYLQVHI